MKKLFIVIDMLNGFAKKGALYSPLIELLIPHIKEEIVKYKNNLFICDAHSKDDIEMSSYPLHCLKGTEEADVVSELKPYVQTKLEKQSTNAFHIFDKKFIDKYDEFVVVGCCTDICILQFVLSLKTYLNQNKINKNVVVLKKCTATFDTDLHDGKTHNEFALELMKNSGVIIK
ncbi:cysteine hydrolase family protein [Mycoplasmopsis alligatoris]|uniref:Isochorismatase-like domain-containing protein n=1 Tax=Mycoplasmopsis alligatoris A21JP2 TaxID=747682 RepID=D4XX09_9BACT|nr:isochorismatase family cysteine hydrolase [Mycoplasmopsis alligatoris]EFF41297.1 conserved hypothetical protein [Mycoplasmopsis alligatoris A21JP2]